MRIPMAAGQAWWPIRPERFRRPVLIVVEGGHDIEFLKRISRLLHADDSRLPDLEQEATHGRVLFLPAGGANLGPWTLSLNALELPEVHIYDREMAPETRVRSQLVAALNARPRCRAFVTRKRSLENYLHASAIRKASGMTLAFGDDESVASLAAQALYEAQPRDTLWDALSPRARKRLRDRAKRWLNTRAVDQMTIAELKERDREGEVTQWFAAIGAMLRTAR